MSERGVPLCPVVAVHVGTKTKWPGAAATAPARPPGGSLMAASTAARVRHKPMKGAPGVYRSQVKGGFVYEVRHPANTAGRRLYEVVGTRLDQAKARAREVHGGAIAPVSVAMTLNEVYMDWKRTRSIRKRSEE